MFATPVKSLVLLLFGFSILTETNAQQLVQERLYKVGTTVRSFASSALTREGNVIMFSVETTSMINQNYLSLIKPNTDTLWIRKGDLNSVGNGLKQVPDSGYVVHFTKRYTSPTASGPVLQKFDKNGNLQWTKPYAMNAFDTGQRLLTAPDSGYFLGGRTIIGGKNRRFTLARTDSLGNVKWRRKYDWTNSDFFSDIQHTLNGNIIMYGVTANPERLKLMLVNQQGDSVLGRTLTIIGGNRVEAMFSDFCSITPLSDKGFVMAAEIDTTVTGASPYLGMVVKVNANLQPVWHYIHRTLPNNVYFTRSRELTDGSIVMLAHERKGAAGTPGNKFFLYHFSSTGALLNIHTFTSSIALQIRAFTMEALPDSSFMIGGQGVITGSPNYTYGLYLAKVKIAGMPAGLQLPNAVINNVKPDLAADKATLGQSYPNPTTSETTIPFSLPKNSKAATICINEVVTGRQVKSYKLRPEETRLKVDLNDLSSGMYTYTLQIEGKPVATKKIVVIR
jgi:hypothetical protein